MLRRIRLIVTDVDGCLTSEKAEPFEIEQLVKINQYNQQAMQPNSLVPPITLCTGRPQPYAEALLKMIHAPYPAICDNGGIIFQLAGDQYFYEKRFDTDWEIRLQELKHAIRQKIFPKAKVDFQPGKETHLTLITRDEKNLADLMTLLKQELVSELGNFSLSATENHINFVPKIFDKGTALLRLTELMQIPPKKIAGVGDSIADLAFLQYVGYPMCPANAAPEVKAKCVFVARGAYAAGLIEIIEKCIAMNRDDRLLVEFERIRPT